MFPFEYQPLPLCGSLPFEYDEFCWNPDGTVESYTAYAVGQTAMPAPRPDLDFFEVPAGADPVTSPICPVPPEGSLHRTFGIPSADGTFIAGRMILPSGSDPLPAVVLNADYIGSDRTGASFDGGVPVWDCAAAHLTALGVAVVSYDDRGWGESGGLPGESFEGRDEDATAVAVWAAAQPEVDSLYLFGHGDGAAHACAAAPIVPDVDGLILAGAAASQLSELLVERAVTWLGEVGAPRRSSTPRSPTTNTSSTPCSVAPTTAATGTTTPSTASGRTS